LRDDLFFRRLEHVLAMDVGGREKHVDARVPCVADRFPRSVDVLVGCARQSGDLRPLHGLGDLADSLEIPDRGDREPRLDDVDLEPGELLGDLELLFGVERDARRLLAVAQGGIEDEDLVHGNLP
jgi:hypothetical protein